MRVESRGMRGRLRGQVARCPISFRCAARNRSPGLPAGPSLAFLCIQPLIPSLSFRRDRGRSFAFDMLTARRLEKSRGWTPRKPWTASLNMKRGKSARHPETKRPPRMPTTPDGAWPAPLATRTAKVALNLALWGVQRKMNDKASGRGFVTDLPNFTHSLEDPLHPLHDRARVGLSTL